jgi:hypothetical protein
MAMTIAPQVVLDPLLAEKFNIVRRAETVDAHGRTVVTPTTTANNIGVIAMNDDIENIRNAFPEMEYATRVIIVVTKKQLRAAVAGYQPDLVVWRGDNYLVRRVSPYPQFGDGFYEAICTSIDFVDAVI